MKRNEARVQKSLNMRVANYLKNDSTNETEEERTLKSDSV